MIPVPASELVCTSVLLFRGCIDEDVQQLMYQELLLLSEGSEEHTQLNALCPAQQPWPLAYWNHPYTHESNTTAKPEKLLSWANDLLRHGQTQASAVPGAAAAGDADSMLCQLYPEDGYLRPHVDNQLGWGVSVSLGDSAQLAFGVGADRRVIVARSGDVIVGDFGTVTHEVVGIIPCSAPVSDDHVEHVY